MTDASAELISELFPAVSKHLLDTLDTTSQEIIKLIERYVKFSTGI